MGEAEACWWCGGVADSNEHKFKRSDLKRSFGDGTWSGDSAVSHISGEHPGLVNSSRSPRLTFRNVICTKCNSERSQPFDRAYDRFAEHLTHDYDKIVESGVLDWAAIFGQGWQSGQRHVIGYWVKHIACRLQNDGVTVLPALPAYLNGTGPLTRLRLRLEIRDDYAAAERHMRSVHDSDLDQHGYDSAVSWTSRATGYITSVDSYWCWRAFRLNYVYDLDDPTGMTNFSARRVTLPRGWNVDPAVAGSACEGCRA